MFVWGVVCEIVLGNVLGFLVRCFLFFCEGCCWSGLVFLLFFVVGGGVFFLRMCFLGVVYSFLVFVYSCC